VLEGFADSVTVAATIAAAAATKFSAATTGVAATSAVMIWMLRLTQADTTLFDAWLGGLLGREFHSVRQLMLLLLLLLPLLNVTLDFL